ncbi:MAG: hypothetical protein K2P14_05205 [Anaeroplasmataceae bacterium]|nr:hypothetical protein [Anaeroplasmataceae bacterium]
MSECIKNCRLCDKFILSQSVTFTGGNLVINLPANAYGNCQKYCIVIAQSIPTATTINAPVVFTIGTGTTQYPFVNCNCTPIYASQVRTRRLYSVRVNTAVNSGVFKYIGKCCLPNSATTTAQSIPVTPAPTAGGDA